MAKGGYRGGMPMGGNMQQMMLRAQKMQQQIQAKQAELEQEETEASSGGGMVTARVNGKHELVSIKINPQAVDPEDVEMLEDMITAAINEAMRAVEAKSEQEMAKITGGMNLGI